MKNDSKIFASEVFKLTFRLMVQKWKLNQRPLHAPEWISHREIIESAPQFLRRILNALEQESKLNRGTIRPLPRNRLLQGVKSHLEAQGPSLTAPENYLLDFLFQKVKSAKTKSKQGSPLASAHH